MGQEERPTIIVTSSSLHTCEPIGPCCHPVRPNKRCRIDESQNQYYASNAAHDEWIAEHPTWYSREDYHAFWDTTNQLANPQRPRRIRGGGGGGGGGGDGIRPPAWFRSLVSLYFSFRTSHPATIQQVDSMINARDHIAMQEMVHQALPEMNEHTVGLQTFIWNCPLVQDYQIRIRHLHQQIQRLQNSHDQSTSHYHHSQRQVEEWIRQTSELNSQASRALAHWVAVASAQNED